MPQIPLTVLLCLVLLTSACSTRQKTDRLSGATAQRLVTYSLERLLEELPHEELQQLNGSSLLLRTHFIHDYEMSVYAERLLRLKLEQKHNIQWANSAEEADFEMDYFFNALGTDSDTFGLSIPITGLSSSGNDAHINVLSVDMFHGISEGYFFLKNNNKDSIKQFPKQNTRVRADSLATPIFTIPINQLD